MYPILEHYSSDTEHFWLRLQNKLSYLKYIKITTLCIFMYSFFFFRLIVEEEKLILRECKKDTTVVQELSQHSEKSPLVMAFANWREFTFIAF